MTKDTQTYAGDVQDMRLVATLKRPGPYVRIWEPYVAEWRPKHLLVAFGGLLAGKMDMGDILCSVSTDGGESWDDPVLVFDHLEALGPRRVAYGNAVLYHPPGQELVWCFAMRCPLHYRDSEDSELCAAYSVDGGRSWQPVELAVQYHSPLMIVAGVVDIEEKGRTRYLLPAIRNTRRHDPVGGSRDQLVLESTSLLEWRLAGYVPQPESYKLYLDEGNIAPGEASEELKIVMRTATWESDITPIDPPTAYSSTSLDGGRTWSSSRPEPELHNTVAKAYFGRDAHGNHLYVYNTGPAWERKLLAYKVKRPGEPWSAEHIFFDAGVHNSYPALVEYTPGQYYAVWDSSESADEHRTAIRFGRFAIS